MCQRSDLPLSVNPKSPSDLCGLRGLAVNPSPRPRRLGRQLSSTRAHLAGRIVLAIERLASSFSKQLFSRALDTPSTAP